jgi:predicted  nucleic acid-binding Zn-ribbon protein
MTNYEAYYNYSFTDLVNELENFKERAEKWEEDYLELEDKVKELEDEIYELKQSNEK